MFKEVTLFVAGAVSGVAASYLYFKNYYERWAQDEINTMRNHYKGDEPVNEEVSEIDIPKKEESKKDEAPDMMEYAKRVKDYEYIDYSSKDIHKENEKDMFEKPYVISPDEFSEFYDYDTVTLTYYANGVLADENDEIIEDPEEIVSADFKNHFGDYDDDVVFVRNDRLKCDYEILRDLDPYEDITMPFNGKGCSV